MNDNKIKCTFCNIRFKNKPDKEGAKKVQLNLKPTDITISDLADNLVHGASFRPGVLYGRKKDDWKEQQLFGLDFDHNTTIEEKYQKAIQCGIRPCFMYTTFSHSEKEHKFRMVFCNDTVITNGNLRDRLQATLMGIMEDADEVCFNRDRLFYGGKGQVVLHPDYEARINAESIIEKYWNDDFGQYISNAKSKSKKKNVAATSLKTNKDKSNIDKEYQPYENLNVKAIKEHDVEYLRKALAHDPMEFETKNEFWDYIYSELDIAELIDIDDPRSFCCVLHDDHNPSASIFTTQNGIQKYRCFSENLTLNIKQLIEMLGNYKSEYKAIQFIMDIYNLSIKESQWSIEQRENIDLMISNITLNKFKELCPQADKNIKNAKDTFLMMLSIARNNIYSEKFSNDDGEIVFYVTNKKLAEYMGKGNNQKKIDKISKYVKMLIYHDLIRILDDDKIPKVLLNRALKYTNGNRNHVNFYAIPSWVIQQLKNIEDNGVRWKEKGYRIGGVSFDIFYRSEGFDVAASLYPQYKKKKNEYGEIVNRTTTQASDERTLKISEVILNCIRSKGYCTEKEVVYILGNQYRYNVTDTQIKRSLNEIMDSYGLKKVKANKALKEQYKIDSDGYPNIIIVDN